MDKFERVVILHRMLESARFPVPKAQLMEALECSRATLYRIISFLRDNLSAPVEMDEESGGVYYDRELAGRYDLPGLWLSASELAALLMAYKVLESRQPGALNSAFTMLRERIEELMTHEHAGKGQLLNKVSIIRSPSRPVDEQVFNHLASSLVEEQQVKLHYHGRIRDNTTERVVSPLGMSFYRENWYLDAWCHLRDGLRRFSVDRIASAEILEEKIDAKLAATSLDDHLQQAYGVFSSEASDLAVIKFAEQAARWVSDERWHDDQKGRFLEDGSYELTVPIGDETEIIMDVLRYGERAEILSPEFLRKKVKTIIKNMLQQY